MTTDQMTAATRIAVTGKGGVGKTTIAAALASALAADHSVIAVDADPDMNLAATLGCPVPTPITELQDLIEERAGGDGGLVSLTPAVDDVIDTHSTAFGQGGRLLTIGAPSGGNTGCMCAQNSFVRTLVASVLDSQHVVMDMEAGVEHLGRGTATAVDTMLVVVEPSRTAIDTAARIQDLAADLGITDVRAVINKSRPDDTAVRELLDLPVVTTLPYTDTIATAGLRGDSPVAVSDQLRTAARTILGAIDSEPATAE